MGREIIIFGDIEIEKRTFHHCKNLFSFKDLDMDNIHVSSKASSGEKNYKYFIDYKDDHDYKIKPLRIIMMLPKTNAYVKRYAGESKWMNFSIKDAELLKRFTHIKKQLDFKPIYN